MSDEYLEDQEEGKSLTWQSITDVDDPPLEWLAENMVAYGYVTDLVGLPSAGKTAFFAALAAQVSTGVGLFKGVKRSPQLVMWCTNEEGYSRDILPRIDAAGGNGKKILCPKPPHETAEISSMSFPEAEFILKEKIREMDVGLLIVEGMPDWARDGMNLDKEKDARLFMLSATRVARETGIAYIQSRHARKNHSGPLLDLGLGSRGIGAVAKIGLVAMQHPKDKDRYFLTHSKPGPAKTVKTWEFTIEKVKGVPVFTPKGECDIDVRGC
jgi:hypothetical protein